MNTTQNGTNRIADFIGMGLRDVRTAAAALGIDVKDKDKYALINDIKAYEEETEALRRECGKRGLPTTGDRQELLLRLESKASDAVSDDHRKVWTYSGVALCILGCLTLGISIPHVSQALARLAHMNYGFAVLFAIVVDFGICGFKIVDTLTVKFKVSKKTHWWVTFGMVCCLGMSAALNASEFMRHAETTGEIALQIGLACFISGFVFVLFLIGSNMLLKCEARTGEEEQTTETPADKLRKAAMELDRLNGIAEKV